jgi:hypothetical protein
MFESKVRALLTIFTVFNFSFFFWFQKNQFDYDDSASFLLEKSNFSTPSSSSSSSEDFHFLGDQSHCTFQVVGDDRHFVDPEKATAGGELKKTENANVRNGRKGRGGKKKKRKEEVQGKRKRRSICRRKRLEMQIK